MPREGRRRSHRVPRGGGEPDPVPVTVFIYALANSNLNTWAATMGASLIASLPALVLVLAAQRYVKEGVITGSGR
ncbi:hypothetical protein [Microbacterium sp. NPDC087591]|uniref:hypothetical protein n=1 Tax=Microbacterium sp. NPDC087591 TaxID=3364192 RepID=UPI0038075BC3